MKEKVLYYEAAKKVNARTMYFQIENKKKYIISKYNPIQEADQLIDKYTYNKNTLWILMGYGLGYISKQLLDRIGDQANILIIERSKENLFDQLEQASEVGEYILQQPNVQVCYDVDEDKLNSILSGIIKIEHLGNINIVGYEPYINHYASYYCDVIQCISKNRNEKVLNNITLTYFAGSFIENTLMNKDYIKESYDIRQHKDHFKNVPAVVVSAGPSLKKNISHLIDFKGLIFVVGRSLDAVLKQGVYPHFIATIDPQSMTYDTFMGNAGTSIPLIATTSAQPKIIQETKGPIYFISDQEEMILGQSVEYLQMGGSVATLCISAAQYMGCSPIIMIGQDLAYTGMKFYDEDCTIEGENTTINSEGQGYKLIKGYDGTPVYTEPNLISYKVWIERFIRNNPSTKFINATEGGALIEGAINLPFKEVISQYDVKGEIEISHVQKINLQNMQEVINDNFHKCSSLKKLSEKAYRFAKKLMTEYKVYHGMRQGKIDEILLVMQKIDEQILDLEQNRFIKMIISRKYNEFHIGLEYQEPVNESKLNKGLRVAELNCKLYQGLVKECNDILSLLEEHYNN